MKHLLPRIAAVATVAIVALVAASTLTAANWPSATLDQIASEVAGKGVAVYCEDDQRPWDQFSYSNLGIPGAWLDGFAPIGGTVVYISPHQCERLHMGLELGYRDAGLAYVTSSIFTLAHEAAHSRGIANEAQAECFSMPLVVPLAVRYFRVPETISVPRTVSSWKRVGKKRVRVSKVVYQTVANPEIARMGEWVSAWHKSRPAEYQGLC